MTKLINLVCKQYKNPLDSNLEEVSRIIDDVLLSKFNNNKSVVIRGIQSGKHKFGKQELVDIILKTGTDRYQGSSNSSVNVSDKPIDLFGYACKIDSSKRPFVLSVLEGFHKWNPKSLERPQYSVDIWTVYDAGKLKNVEYTHSIYNVKVSDGYRFKSPENKTDALLAVIVLETK